MGKVKGITVDTPASVAAHITAADDAAIYQALAGTDVVLNVGRKLEASAVSNNKVRIYDGVFCVGGHFGRIEAGDFVDVAIENGQASKKRNDLIVARFYKGNGSDTMTLNVRKGIPGVSGKDPQYSSDDLYNGGQARDFPLYRVKLDGINISIEPLFRPVTGLQDLEPVHEEGAVEGGVYKADKYVDGRMDMTITKTFPAFSSNDWQEHQLAFGNFPIPFADTPDVVSVTNVGIGGTPYRALFMGVDTLTQRGIKSLCVYRVDQGQSIVLTFTVILTGRWK